jgi:hypothetical protein
MTICSRLGAHPRWAVIGCRVAKGVEGVFRLQDGITFPVLPPGIKRHAIGQLDRLPEPMGDIGMALDVAAAIRKHEIKSPGEDRPPSIPLAC